MWHHGLGLLETCEGPILYPVNNEIELSIEACDVLSLPHMTHLIHRHSTQHSTIGLIIFGIESHDQSHKTTCDTSANQLPLYVE